MKTMNDKIDLLREEVRAAKDHIEVTAKIVVGIEKELKEINAKYEAFSKRLKKVED